MGMKSTDIRPGVTYVDARGEQRHVEARGTFILSRADCDQIRFRVVRVARGSMSGYAAGDTGIISRNSFARWAARELC
jgi:hypothetical protein